MSALVDAVWGDDPPRNARTTLQTYVSRLRGQLGAEAVVHGLPDTRSPCRCGPMSPPLRVNPGTTITVSGSVTP